MFWPLVNTIFPWLKYGLAVELPRWSVAGHAVPGFMTICEDPAPTVLASAKAAKVRTPNGMVRFDQLPKRFQIVNSRGTFDARLLIHSGEREMIDIGGGVQCTVRHLFRDDAGNIKEAQEIHPDKTSFTLHGRVYNLHVESNDPDDHWFECGDGITAHNYFPIKP